jgi:hypothetical protein
MPIGAAVNVRIGDYDPATGKQAMQEIPLKTPAELALYISLFNAKIIPSTTYPAIAPIPKKQFFAV